MPPINNHYEMIRTVLNKFESHLDETDEFYFTIEFTLANGETVWCEPQSIWIFEVEASDTYLALGKYMDYVEPDDEDSALICNTVYDAIINTRFIQKVKIIPQETNSSKAKRIKREEERQAGEAAAAEEWEAREAAKLQSQPLINEMARAGQPNPLK